ncbi:NB-ARC domain-containing protein [Amycolatopsis sp. cmx-4-83]|uniref:NB-ARC domain-containing protein n=1 Tax=Amycolatopsis sp. cmx-4-83 TaxID=2790940 RepID=UPI00397A43C1
MAHDGKAVHRSIVAVDIEGFGARRRTDADRLEVRTGMHQALREAFGTAGADLSSCHVDDSGDGVLVLVPPEVPKSTLVDLLPRALADALARHNEAAEPGAAMRMRMAVHAGEVTFDAHGVAGSAIVHAFRMLDASRVRVLLAKSDASVVLVVSAWIQDEVVRHLEPRVSARFTADEVTVKETTAPVWVRLFPAEASESVSRRMPQRPAADWRRHAYVNHDKLFGARDTVDAVTAAIMNERGGDVVSVVGEGGVGKTAISYEAVQAAVGSGGFTRVAWVSATKPHSGAGNSGSEPYRVTYWSDLQLEIATQLGLDLGPSRALWSAEFGRRVAGLDPGERLLVVVDNLETVPDATDAVQQLRRFGITNPHRLVVTTRWELTPHVDTVREHRVSPLSSADALALVRHIGANDPGLRSAPDSALQPVLDVTGGTPFLIRLAVRQYLSSHHPLDQVLHRLRELRDEAAPDLAAQVRSYLYVESLRELERRHGEEFADALLGAFCVKGRGDAFRFAELGEVSGIDDEDGFGAVLSTACQLSLITSFGDASEATLDRGYTIHSLLYDFTCGLP